MRRAVFLDRDGTVTEEGDWSDKAAPPRLIPGAVQALKRLTERGVPLFVVTNQSGVARGYYTEQDVATFHARMASLFEAGGVSFAGIGYCPHLPTAGCSCRKPETRYLADMAGEHGLDLERCYVVGDQTTDVAMGRRNGCRTVLVQTGFGGGDGKASAQPDAVVADIREAVDWILADIDVQAGGIA